MEKIFGVGLYKTGTTTLGQCFKILGYKHGGGHWNILGDYWGEHSEKWPRYYAKIFQRVRRFESFEDAPYCYVYEELDREFPNAKFILTLRKSPQALAESERRWHLSQANKHLSNEELCQIKKRYELHNEAVRAYFSGRPEKFLEVCWENGDGWQKLCDFLDCPVPVGSDGKPLPLPRENPAKSNLALFSKVKRQVRRLLYRLGISIPHRK